MTSRVNDKNGAFSAHDLLEDVSQKGELFIDNEEVEGSRRALLTSARALVASLESPAETLARMNWFETGRWAAVRIGIDLKLFEKICGQDGSPKSAVQLADQVGADHQLLDRLLKTMAADRVIDETGVGEYTPNGVSRLLAGPAYQGMVCDSFDNMLLGYHALPQYLRAIEYRNPDDENNTPWQMGRGTQLHYFEWLNLPENTQKLASFNGHMTAKNIGMKHWFSVVNLSSIFGPPELLDPDTVLLVDIGGNVGHDLIAFEKTVLQSYPGKLVLQDLPQVVKNAELPSSSQIEVQPHDFFQPEYIEGAKAYYLHMVLHDWPDDKCREILQNITPAMKKDYSKILINDAVIPAQGAGWQETGIDMMMMTVHSAIERTEQHWEKLLKSVGLEITKIWHCEGCPEKLIEAELPHH